MIIVWWLLGGWALCVGVLGACLLLPLVPVAVWLCLAAGALAVVVLGAFVEALGGWG